MDLSHTIDLIAKFSYAHRGVETKQKIIDHQPSQSYVRIGFAETLI